MTLGGGLGILGRAYGVTFDHLIAAQPVPADGRLVQCDEDHEEDLFWALRGAGDFGVVTPLVFRTVPAGCDELPPGMAVLPSCRLRSSYDEITLVG